MTAIEFKERIEKKICPEDLFVFVYHDTDYLPISYINEIAKQQSREVVYVDTQEGLSADTFSADEMTIRVYRCDVLSVIDRDIKNAFAVCRKIDKKLQEEFADIIIDIPKIEECQTKDFASCLLLGMKQADIEYLHSLYGKNIYRLDNEVRKLTLFDGTVRDSIFKQMFADGQYNDVVDKSVLDLASALMQKNAVSLKAIIKQLNNMAIEPLALLALLYNNVRNTILVHLGKNAAAESCGLSNGMFWAIKKNNGGFTKAELVRLFMFLSEIDCSVKSGSLGTDTLTEYMIVKFCLIGGIAI